MIFEPILPIWLLIVLEFLIVGAVAMLYLKAEDRSRLRTRRWLYRIGLLVIALLMAWRPQINLATTQERSTLMDVYLVVDTTQSMAAEDYDGTKTRLTGVANDASAMMKQLSGARFSVMIFNNHTTIALGLTTDTSAVQSAIESVRPIQYTYANSSSISEPVDALYEQITKTLSHRPDRLQVVYYFGDGEQTSKTPIVSFEKIRSKIAGGAVLGYGSEHGGKMRISSYISTGGKTSDEGYITYYDSANGYQKTDALSKINEKNLRNIASELGVGYYHRTAKDGVDSIVSSVHPTSVSPSEKDERISTAYDLDGILAIGGFVLLAYDYRALLLERRRKLLIQKTGAA